MLYYLTLSKNLKNISKTGIVQQEINMFCLRCNFIVTRWFPRTFDMPEGVNQAIQNGVRDLGFMGFNGFMGYI